MGEGDATGAGSRQAAARMKAGALIAALAAGAGVLYLLTRPARAAIGDVAPDGSGSTVVRGPVSGNLYAVGIGTAGPGGTLYSVFTAPSVGAEGTIGEVFGLPVGDQPGVLLFTYVDGPSSTGAAVSKSLTARNPDAPTVAVETALQDFGFR
jgi:hypothetical protein